MTVTFYISAQNDKGDGYKSPVGSFSFDGRITKEEAIQKAQMMLEEQRKVPNWLDVAEFYEIL